MFRILCNSLRWVLTFALRCIGSQCKVVKSTSLILKSNQLATGAYKDSGSVFFKKKCTEKVSVGTATAKVKTDVGGSYRNEFKALSSNPKADGKSDDFAIDLVRWDGKDMCECKAPITTRQTTTSTTSSTTTTTPREETTTSSTTTSTTSTTVSGCTNKLACNYNKAAISDDGSCNLPKKCFNCKGECQCKKDACDVCGGKGPGSDMAKCGSLKGVQVKWIGDGTCDALTHLVRAPHAHTH